MYRLSQAVRSTRSEQGGILLDVAQGRMFDLNPVATRIVEYLREDRGESEIIDRISEDFSVSRDQVASDFQQFLMILIQQRLVEDDSPLSR